MTSLRLWLLLRRRTGSDRRDPARLTGLLAVLSLAVTTAVSLVVAAGFLAFVDRAARGESVGEYVAGLYPILAALALVLLAVPLITLGSAATKLAVARRDARLASLRLAGATTGQVITLTLLDAAAQAVLGAVVGIGGYLALIPAFSQLHFQGRPFDAGELWLGAAGTAAAVAVVLVVVLGAALGGLRRIAITPLGAAQRVTPAPLRWVRLLAVIGAIGAAAALGSAGSLLGAAMVVAVLAVIGIGMGTLNLVGPWVIGVIGRVGARTARAPAALLAARRVMDDPRSAWRSVGGVALATFVAVITAVTAVVTPDAVTNSSDLMLVTDLRTGALLTLGIAGVLAAVTTGVVQAGRMIDGRSAARSLRLAGAEMRVLDRARLGEVALPLLATVALSAGLAVMLVAPLLGAGLFLQPAAIAQIGLSVVGACALVLAGAAGAGLVARATI